MLKHLRNLFFAEEKSYGKFGFIAPKPMIMAPKKYAKRKRKLRMQKASRRANR